MYGDSFSAQITIFPCQEHGDGDNLLWAEWTPCQMPALVPSCLSLLNSKHRGHAGTRPTMNMDTVHQGAPHVNLAEAPDVMNIHTGKTANQNKDKAHSDLRFLVYSDLGQPCCYVLCLICAIL